MLIPRRVKHRKQHRPKRSGNAKGGTAVAFGDFGLQATEGGYRPLTKKPAETRMGSGKGSPEFWIANVKPGRVLFEISGVTLDVANQALSRAAHKLPVKSRVVIREEV
ncbi:MAG: 50S ribosomal protein L16 [Actinobacteria bacterium]|nr:50S ribosomal protein L16 [Actinomycetota bacterium]